MFRQRAGKHWEGEEFYPAFDSLQGDSMDTVHDPVRHEKTEEAGVLFARFLDAGTATEAERCRERLIETHLLPLIRKIVARKLRVDPMRFTGRQGAEEERAQDLY